MGSLRPIRALSVASLVLLCMTLAGVAAAATPRDSIKLLLPKQLHTETRVTTVLTGYASGKKPEVSLYEQTEPCASTFTADAKFRNLTIWIGGGHVKGHYRYTDKVGVTSPTPGAENFCAYLTSFSPTFSYITEAHQSLRVTVSS